VRDALKNYLALASGLTEVTKQQAKSAAKSLVKQGEASRGQVDKIASDLLRQSRNNREMIVALVRNEVEKTVGRIGIASTDEVGKLTKRLQSVESAVRGGSAVARTAATTGASRLASTVGRGGAQKRAGGRTGTNGSTGATSTTPTRAAKPAAKKAGAKKAGARKTAAKKGTTSSAPAATTAKKTAAKKAATKSTARKPAAKKSAAKKSAAKKSAAKKSAGR
jgi:polyhydroxyalkanoate synthesis regulator phasin